jgi:hypothetical protein
MSMEAPEYKFGQKVLPRDASIEDKQALMLELSDHFLDMSNIERTDALRRWASGQQRAATSGTAQRYLGRHRWRSVDGAWVDDYEVGDLVQREQFIGKPELRSRQQQIALASANLQHVMQARAVQTSADADAKLQEHQAELEQHLALLLTQQQLAVQEMQAKQAEWESQPLAVEGRLADEEVPEEAQPAPQPAPQHQRHRSLTSTPINAAAVGLLCGVGLSRFLPQLFHRKRHFGRSLLGLVAIALVSAATLVTPGSSSSGKEQHAQRQEGDATHINMLKLEFSDTES